MLSKPEITDDDGSTFPALVFLVAEIPLAQSLAEAIGVPAEVRRCPFFVCPDATYARVGFPADSAFTDGEVRLGKELAQRFVSAIAGRFQRTGIYTPYHVRGWRDAPIDDVCAAFAAAGVRVVRAPELIAETGLDLALTDFPFQSQPVPSAGDFLAAASQQLLAAAGLPDHLVPYFGTRSLRGDATLEPEVRVGLRVGSIRKKTDTRSWTAIQLSFAAFGARTGALLAWSTDLDPESTHRNFFNCVLEVRDGRAGPNIIDLVLLDKQATAPIRALAAGGRVKPPRASAETPLSHDDVVSAIAFTPDGARLASVGEDGRLRIWDLRIGAATASVVIGKRGIHALALSPDGGTVATGPVRPGLFSIPSRKRQRQIGGHPNGDVKDLRFSPSGALLATASGRVMHEGDADHSVALWDPSTGKPINRWALPVEYRELRVAFSPDEARLFVFGLAPWGTLEGGTLWAFDVATRAVRPVAECQADGARSSPSRPALVATATEVVATNGNDAWILDAGTLELKRRVRLLGPESPDLLATSAPAPDGSRAALIVGPRGVYDAVLVVSLDGVAAPKRFTIPAGTVGWSASGRGCLAWSPSGKTVAAALGPRIFHWDV